MPAFAAVSELAKADAAKNQYIILAESQRAHVALAEERARTGELLAENRRLAAEADTAGRDCWEVVAFLRSELLAREAEVTRLTAALAQAGSPTAEAALVTGVAAAHAAGDKRARELTAEATAAAAAATAELAETKAALAAALAPRQARRPVYASEVQRELVAAQVAQLRAENHQLRSESAAKVREYEARMAEAAARARREAEAAATAAQRLRALQEGGSEGVGEGEGEGELGGPLDAGGQRLAQRCRSLALELRFHIAESEALAQEVHDAEQVAAGLRRELAIRAGSEQQFALRGTTQARQLREEQARGAGLQRGLAKALYTAERERSAARAAAAKELDALSIEAAALRRLARARGRELRTVRRLAQAVLRQRSDVETFLVAALQQVSEELLKEDGGVGGQAAHERTDLWLQDLSKADVKGMSWAQRERVLQLLFARLSDAAAAAYFTELPKHSFAVEEEPPLRGVVSDAGPASLV